MTKSYVQTRKRDEPNINAACDGCKRMAHSQALAVKGRLRLCNHCFQKLDQKKRVTRK